MVVLTQNTTFYVDRVNGSDANAGSQAHPWRTIQRAGDYVAHELDFSWYTVTVQLVGTDYAENNVVISGPYTHGHCWELRGDPSNPGACMWAPLAAGVTLTSTDAGWLEINGVELGFYASGGVCLYSFQCGVIDIKNCMFGSCDGGVHIHAGVGGKVNITGPYSIAGNAANHMLCDRGDIVVGSGAYMPVVNSFSDSFCRVDRAGYVELSASYSGSGSGSACVATQYRVRHNGTLSLGGHAFPGNSAGGYDTGGQVF